MFFSNGTRGAAYVGRGVFDDAIFCAHMITVIQRNAGSHHQSATSTFSSPDEILKQCWKPQKKAPRVRVVLQLLYVVR